MPPATVAGAAFRPTTVHSLIMDLIEIGIRGTGPCVEERHAEVSVLADGDDARELHWETGAHSLGQGGKLWNRTVHTWWRPNGPLLSCGAERECSQTQVYHR